MSYWKTNREKQQSKLETIKNRFTKTIKEEEEQESEETQTNINLPFVGMVLFTIIFVVVFCLVALEDIKHTLEDSRHTVVNTTEVSDLAEVYENFDFIGLMIGLGAVLAILVSISVYVGGN